LNSSRVGKKPTQD